VGNTAPLARYITAGLIWDAVAAIALAAGRGIWVALEFLMLGYKALFPPDGTEWLLGIGRRLRAQYTALGVPGPLPPRLAALVDTAEASHEEPVNRSTAIPADSDAPSTLPSVTASRS
jgi:hypothetical protein